MMPARSTRCALVVMLTLACACNSAWADPMRPLAVPGKAVAAASAPITPAGTSARTPDAPRPLDRLVAIRQDSQGRMQALLGERWVSAGDTVAQATVLAISANQVDLKVGKTLSSVHLLPPLLASTAAAPSQATSPATERGWLAQTDRSRAERLSGSSPR